MQELRYPQDLMDTMKRADDIHAWDTEWQQLIEDAVSMYNDANGTDYKEREAFLYYVDNSEHREELGF